MEPVALPANSVLRPLNSRLPRRNQWILLRKPLASDAKVSGSAAEFKAFDAKVTGFSGGIQRFQNGSQWVLLWNDWLSHLNSMASSAKPLIDVGKIIELT
jgi:hypothetical protein